MKRMILILVGLLCLAFAGRPSAAAISIVTTDTTLAYIAKEVGGNRVTVESLSRATDDPHAVEPRPSMVVKLQHAQVFVRIGMDLDMWADGALQKSGNNLVMTGGRGYCDAHVGLRVQEIPPARLDPSMGDIHVYGNPHYLLDPANGILAANNIAKALSDVDPAGRPYYSQQLQNFGQQILTNLNRWKAELAPYRGRQVTTYHRTWVYFMSRFGL